MGETIGGTEVAVFDKRLNVDPKMMLEIASGLEEPAVIATRYGYSEQAWAELSGMEGFRAQVDRLVAELRLNGVTFQRKSAMLAEELLMDLYIKAKNTKSLAEVLQVAQFAARMGKLEPSATDNRSGGGTTFEVNFNFSRPKAEGMVIDMVEGRMRVPQQIIDALNTDLGVEDASPD
jgi:hypothetical protein